MNRVQAAEVLIDVCKRERQPNLREFRRLLVALNTLGMLAPDMREVCRYLDICRKDGRPWSADLTGHTPWKFDGAGQAPVGADRREV